MEVLIHEASNRQEIRASEPTCTIDLKSTSKTKREDVDTPFQIKHKDDKGPIDIMFENITYTVRLGFRKGKKEILHGINGRLPSKQLIALMGPSGAGKSTLLDILSGFRVTGVQGNCSAYITQDDRLEPLLTVVENMRVAADLKLPSSTSRQEKEIIIEEILTTLGLYEHIYTRSGRLSGGQKKRLSIALELVNNPTVMFLDEPTTGLDSSSCMQVINLLKVLARQGRTIICTIHQPSASMFQLFDQVYVLAKGECMYQGTTNKLLPYLESIKLTCPMYHNPADYIIELACGEYGEDKIDTLRNGSQNGSNWQWFENSADLMDAKSLRATRPLINKFEDNSGLHATNLAHQIKILLRRGYIMCKRDTNGTFMGPTLAVPLMMFAGFGVSLRDLPNYLKWGSYISYLRYGLEGFVGAIYGFDRPILDCKEKGELYCHYRYPSKFLSDIAMRGDQFWNDIIALSMILIITRCGAYLLLRWKIVSYR
ncbi:hypothetical protein ACFW04_007724 [Cataglyphis niger]